MRESTLRTKWLGVALLGALAGGCGREEAPALTLDTAPVARRDIVVAVEASGSIEPLVTVEIKSKASGEVLKSAGQTGDLVPAGTLLVQIDKRAPRNLLAQADSELEAAIARRAIAEAQSNRAKKLLQDKLINEVDYEKTVLDFANAKAEVVRAQVTVENARIALEDTDVRAPITGTIIEKLVETGQVISSPMKDFGGGTSLLRMADLSTVQVRTLVDETDVGKISPGQPATVRVTAYPNQPFDGHVLKIEPLAKADASVTTFSVLIRLANPESLLRPGMNADVEIRVAERKDVLAIPTVALKTPREIATAARAVGLTEDEVRGQLGTGPSGPPSGRRRPTGDREGSVGTQGQGYEFGARYWVFVERNGAPVAANVRTGLTDLEYSEIVEGLGEKDAVVLLPSSGLLQNQQRAREAMRRFSFVPGMNRQEGGNRAGR